MTKGWKNKSLPVPFSSRYLAPKLHFFVCLFVSLYGCCFKPSPEHQIHARWLGKAQYWAELHPQYHAVGQQYSFPFELSEPRNKGKGKQSRGPQNPDQLTPGAEPTHSWGSAQWEATGGNQGPIARSSNVLGGADKAGRLQGSVHQVWVCLQGPGQAIPQDEGFTWK